MCLNAADPVERIGTLKSIAFDKTGTLTEEKPRVTDFRDQEDLGEAEVPGLAANVEAASSHPLAAQGRRAIHNVGFDDQEL